ncbi:hypothetical protein [Citrobacter amalonaticus]|uniref:hypothetical protein n=1 Tax=Citrobacter amalonaticus TaxID=35703 RepID=UPI000621720D|nr:hypothetical protein [Citrobacter amalonaticus]KKF68971.1 hypothetical protein XU19_12275 [Vibrio parahaemolyticus]KKY42325.1 hypothetical protein AAY51_15415 [Vibrio parahaemolyticus]KOP95114.1 hypothetical protein AL012_15260 [Citrobacter amalonaticus]KOP97169.1 hypothetical protein ALC61_10720 [Citrobacter amalonaticus]PNP32673.1 hypothetical protein AL525_001655 [Citrobacter amalonaticus]
MTALAFWLAFFSILPVLYWAFKILFDRMRFMCTPRHRLLLEYIDDQGVSHKQLVDVTTDDEFYEVAMSAIRNGKTVKGGSGD